MRVVHIVHGKANPQGHNGISRVVYHLNRSEKALGLRSEIWGLVDGLREPELHHRDAEVSVMCFPRARAPLGRHAIIDRLRAERGDIDLVHFHMIFFLDKDVIAAELERLGLPFVATTHGTYTTLAAYRGKKALARLLYERRFLNRAAEVHALTREEGTGLRRYGYEGPVFVVPNGIDLSEVPAAPPAPEPEPDPAAPIRAIWVGVLRDDKNLPALIRALALLPAALRARLRLTLVGPDHRGNAGRYRAMAERLGVGDCLEMPGPLYGPEKFAAIHAADFHVMPSHTEGMSLALLDAFACAKPALVTSGCGLLYYRDRGFLEYCEPYDQDIARGIETICARRGDWPAMGARARACTEEVFDWTRVAEAMKANYARVLEGRGNIRPEDAA